MNFKSILENPVMVDEAADRLQNILTENELKELQSTTYDDLIMLHFSLDRDIRAAFGLNTNNAELLGDKCADDVSMEIIEGLWGKLDR